ncbi:MAG TPA: hypothetical protein VIZ90_15990 [Rhizobiaceae bacterium]
MESTPTARRAPLLAAGALMALGAVASGCQVNSGALMYAGEEHAQQVEAWCYHNLVGRRTEALMRRCVEQVWVNVPGGACDVNICTDTGRFGPPYRAVRWPAYK